MTASVARRHEADAGLVPDDDGVELRKDLHALIDRFTTSAGERRQTHDGCAAFLSALDGVSRSDPASSVGPLRADDLAALARRR